MSPFHRHPRWLTSRPGHSLVAGAGARWAQNTLLRAGIDEFATVLFGGGSALETGETLRNLITGFVNGLRDTDPEYRFRRIVLCEIDPARYEEMRQKLYQLLGAELADDLEVTIDELPPAPLRAVPVPARAPAADSAMGMNYLLVREGPPAAGGTTWQSTLLSSGGKATVITRVQPYDRKKLPALLQQSGRAGADPRPTERRTSSACWKRCAPATKRSVLRWGWPGSSPRWCASAGRRGWPTG